MAKRTPPKSSGPSTGTATAVSSRGGKAPVHSENRLLVPHYTPRDDSDTGPTPQEVLSAAGLQRTRKLETAEMRTLVKAPLDITSVSDQAVLQYAADAAALGLRDFPPELLQALHNRLVFLRPRAVTLEEAATLAQHQTMVAASDLQDALLRIRRRLMALAEEDPELLRPWQFLLEFFDRLYKGRSATVAEHAPPTEGGPA